MNTQDSTSTTPATANLKPHERWHGFEYGRAQRVGFARYAAVEEHEAKHGRRVRFMSDSDLDGALYRLEQARPDLRLSLDKARTFNEAMAAVKAEHPHAPGTTHLAMVEARCNELLRQQLRSYGSPKPPPDVVQLSAQRQDDTERFCFAAERFFREVHGRSPTQLERGRAFSEYAKQPHAEQTPAEWQGYFGFTKRAPSGASPQTTAPGCAAMTAPVERQPYRLGAAIEEEHALLDWVRQALEWWAKIKGNDPSDRAAAYSGFHREMPWLTPRLAISRYGLPDPVAATTDANGRAAAGGTA
jgi:hypothetical protein